VVTLLIQLEPYSEDSLSGNYLRLTFSGLGSVTGTTGRVVPLSSHLPSSKSDGYEPTLKDVLVLQIFRKPKHMRSKHKICHTQLLYTHLLMFNMHEPIS
jgi:hypothetical protein